jgi:uroporphyrinogen decarboxylase
LKPLQCAPILHPTLGKPINRDRDFNQFLEDIIACGVDAKHSFDDAIIPARDFKKKYGKRITPLGGLDVDVICRSGEKDLREYTRRNIA